MARRGRKKQPLKVESLRHEEAERTNIPSAEHQPLLKDDERHPIEVAFERRNPDLDPQLVWRGKDPADWSDLVTTAPPLYIQEKVQPKALIDDLRRSSRQNGEPATEQLDLFADFNGLPEGADRTDFYQHQANWSNRMILGDSLQVMASLAEREGLRGQVQCIYIDPPYGIKFNSNFQWSTTSRDVRDGKAEHITREPEQVKAFRDTWRDGIHSYLTYLRDRLTVARDLLSDSGSIFVQIGDENVHRVRALVDEVFGGENFVQSIVIKKKSSSVITEPINDFIIWSSKNREKLKVRRLSTRKDPFSETSRFNRLELPNILRIGVKEASREQMNDSCNRLLNDDYPMVSQDPQAGRIGAFSRHGDKKWPGKNRHWTLDPDFGMRRVDRANRLRSTTNTVRGVVYLDDFGQEPLNNIWEFHGERDPVYVVQTNRGIVQRCLLLTTDPGDLVLDPTCGSGTTAYVAEQWGRRWITIDTSRVALALARARIMGARYPWYLLADSPDGQRKEAEVSGRDLALTIDHAPLAATHGDIRLGFVYQRVSHITLKDIANNAEIEVIWERLQPPVEAALADLNQALRGHPTPYAAPPAGVKGQHIDFGAPDGTTVTLPSGESAPANGLLEWEVPRERTRRLARGRPRAAGRILGRPHRAPAGDRRLHRRQGRLRIPLRQALRGPAHRARGRAVHRGEPVAAPHAGRGRAWRADRPGCRDDGPLRRAAGFRDDDPGQPAHHRRTASAQRGPHHLQLAHALARSLRVRRRTIRERRRAAGEA